MGNSTAKDMHVNAALSTMAVEYFGGGSFAADEIFPKIEVVKESDKYYVFGREDVDDDVETLRADGAESNEVDWSVDKATYTAEAHSLKHLVTDRQMNNADAPIRPKQRSAKVLLNRIKIGVEKRVKTSVTNTSVISYATPEVKWDAASGVEIEKNIDTAKEAFSLQFGNEPNKIVIPTQVARVMKRDSSIRELIKYTQDNLLVNGDLPPTVFNMRTVIPGAVVNGAATGLTQSLERIWSDNHVVLAYVEDNPDQYTCTAGVQARVKQGGTYEVLVKEWREEKREGDMIEVQIIQDELLMCTAALYILKDVLT